MSSIRRIDFDILGMEGFNVNLETRKNQSESLFSKHVSYENVCGNFEIHRVAFVVGLVKLSP